MSTEIVLPVWALWIVGAASVVAATRALYHSVLKPLVNVVRLAEEHIPVLVEISEEFRPNSGSSLRDAIDRLNDNVDKILAFNKQFESYIHERIHDILDTLSTIQAYSSLDDEGRKEVAKSIAEIKKAMERDALTNNS